MSNISTGTSDNSKIVAIVSHFSLIGWVIALVINNKEKSELGNFYLRQTLGLMLLGLLAIVPGLVFIIVFIIFILWIISLVNAVNGKMEPLPIIGKYFQDWFSGL